MGSSLKSGPTARSTTKSKQHETRPATFKTHSNTHSKAYIYWTEIFVSFTTCLMYWYQQEANTAIQATGNQCICQTYPCRHGHRTLNSVYIMNEHNYMMSYKYCLQGQWEERHSAVKSEITSKLRAASANATSELPSLKDLTLWTRHSWAIRHILLLEIFGSRGNCLAVVFCW